MASASISISMSGCASRLTAKSVLVGSELFEVLIAFFGDRIIRVDIQDVGDGAHHVVQARAHILYAVANRLADQADLAAQIADAADRAVQANRGFPAT